MNKEIFIERILVYYDIPQVFIAKDAIDTRYLCMYIGSQSDYDSYVGVQISQSRLFELFAGKIDLRTAYQAPEIQEYFDIHNAGDLRVVAMNSSIEDQYLPDEDFFTAIDLDDTIEREVLSLNKPVLHIGLEDGHSTPRADILNVEYMGSFAKVDATRTGLWTFDVAGEEGTVGTISGRVSDINILTGVVIKSERYRITCEQKTKSDAASIVGKNIYTLVGIERVE